VPAAKPINFPEKVPPEFSISPQSAREENLPADIFNVFNIYIINCGDIFRRAAARGFRELTVQK
jgi:hypothetical protein